MFSDRNLLLQKYEVMEEIVAIVSGCVIVGKPDSTCLKGRVSYPPQLKSGGAAHGIDYPVMYECPAVAGGISCGAGGHPPSADGRLFSADERPSRACCSRQSFATRGLGRFSRRTGNPSFSAVESGLPTLRKPPQPDTYVDDDTSPRDRDAPIQGAHTQGPPLHHFPRPTTLAAGAVLEWRSQSDVPQGAVSGCRSNDRAWMKSASKSTTKLRAAAPPRRLLHDTGGLWNKRVLTIFDCFAPPPPTVGRRTTAPRGDRNRTTCG